MVVLELNHANDIILHKPWANPGVYFFQSLYCVNARIRIAMTIGISDV